MCVATTQFKNNFKTEKNIINSLEKPKKKKYSLAQKNITLW